jgi:hypothetical protein
MTEELKKFRIGVVTVWEVEASDERDAARVAEGALQHFITALNTSDSRRNTVIEWEHTNGHTYAATLFRGPAEIGAAVRNQYVNVSVH